MKELYAALLVPFDEKGDVIDGGLREVIRHNLDYNKLDGLYVNGSSGENFLLSTEQKKQIFKITAEETNKQAKLIAQVGSLNLDEAVELAQYATELGYDCLSAVTPFYYKFSFAEIKDYYETIINATNNNMIIYSIPALTGVNMTMAQFDDLFANEKIIGVKYTAADFFLLERLRNKYPNKLIYSGFDEMLIQAAVSGVDGAIGSTYNVNGRRARDIFDLVEANKIKEAYDVQHTTNDLIEQILGLGLYPTLKAILNTKGIQAGTVRKPMRAFDPNNQAAVKQLVDQFQL